MVTSSGSSDAHDRASVDGVGRRPVDAAETTAANHRWWDAAAADYQAEHGAFLGGGDDAGFVWGPEGLDESDAALLAPRERLAGQRVLEVGCGAAQCGRWLAAQGAEVIAFDLALAQLRHARPATGLRLVQADAARIPLRNASVDLACSSYGALPFVADAPAVLREVARVLKVGGRFAFSVSHPIRWAFPDDPGRAGLTASGSYFDRAPYVETDADGRATYVEHHRTMGDWVGHIVRAGFVLCDIVEPEWPDQNQQTWGGWSPLRGRLLPGTAIFVCERPQVLSSFQTPNGCG